MSPDNILVLLIKCIAVVAIVLTAVPIAVYVERRGIAFIQNRCGPNRVGPFGIIQPIADAVKLLLKENVMVSGADSAIYKLAPAFAMIPALLTFIVIPMTGMTDFFGLLSEPTRLQVANLNIGFLFIFAVSSLGVYGVCLGGWSSNNKWALLGGLRSAAQMVSYEISMGLSVLGVVMLAGSLNLVDLIEKQSAHGIFSWYVWDQPLAFVLFVVAIFAETNRLPFDLPEAETELTGGYHTEYSSMRFAIFFMGEYAAMFAMSALGISLFLGGYHAPFLTGMIPESILWLWQLGWFALKAFAFLFLFVWVRGTFPRLRYDQLMGFGWKVMLPLALINLLWTAGAMTFLSSVPLVMWAFLFFGTLAFLWWADVIVTRRVRQGRRRPA